MDDIDYKYFLYEAHFKFRHRKIEDCSTWYDGCNCIIPYDHFDDEYYRRIIQRKEVEMDKNAGVCLDQKGKSFGLWSKEDQEKLRKWVSSGRKLTIFNGNEWIIVNTNSLDTHIHWNPLNSHAYWFINEENLAYKYHKIGRVILKDSGTFVVLVNDSEIPAIVGCGFNGYTVLGFAETKDFAEGYANDWSVGKGKRMGSLGEMVLMTVPYFNGTLYEWAVLGQLKLREQI